MNKLLIFAAIAMTLAQPGAAQNGPPPLTRSAAPAEPGAIPLYGKDTPGSAATEVWGRMGPRNFMVRNVTRPTLTPFFPKPGKANGAAVIVAPGGAFMLLLSTRLFRSTAGDADPGATGLYATKANAKPARNLFAGSILYLFALFATLLVEHGLLS